MKRAIAISLLLFVVCCRGGADRQGVRFTHVHSLGQKGTYSMKYNIREEDIWADEADNSVNEELWDAVIETEVTEQKPDGTWTLLTRFVKLDVTADGERDEETNKAWSGIAFTTVKDKDGRIVDIPATGEEINNDFKQRLILLDPTMMLPAGPVKVGDSWPIDITHTIERKEVPVVQTLRGTGTLKELKEGRALIDFAFTSEVSFTGPEADAEAEVWLGDCHATATFDMEKARFTTNRIDMKIETPGDAWADNPDLIKIVITSTMQLDIIGE